MEWKTTLLEERRCSSHFTSPSRSHGMKVYCCFCVHHLIQRVVEWSRQLRVTPFAVAEKYLLYFYFSSNTFMAFCFYCQLLREKSIHTPIYKYILNTFLENSVMFPFIFCPLIVVAIIHFFPDERPHNTTIIKRVYIFSAKHSWQPKSAKRHVVAVVVVVHCFLHFWF